MIAGAGYIGRMSHALVASLAGRPLLLTALWGTIACGDHETSQRVAQAFQAGAPTPDEVQLSPAEAAFAEVASAPGDAVHVSAAAAVAGSTSRQGIGTTRV